MAETDFLQLYKKDPVLNRNDTFNITTMLNDNWDKLDTVLFNMNKDKVDKITGKGLSTNDFTTTLKNKLDGIDVGANKYIHPDNHSLDIITETTTKKIMTNLERIEVAKVKDKVDAVAGKGLSKNDYTDEEKQEVGKIKNLATLHELALLEDEVRTHKADITLHGSIGTKKVDETKLEDRAILTYSTAKGKWMAERHLDDTTGSHGSGFLIEGNKNRGYFGRVDPTTLISRDDFFLKLGFTEGNPMFNNGESWYKFVLNNKILFITRRPWRNDTTRVYLNSLSLINGTILKIDGFNYVARILKNADEYLNTLGYFKIDGRDMRSMYVDGGESDPNYPRMAIFVLEL